MGDGKSLPSPPTSDPRPLLLWSALPFPCCGFEQVTLPSEFPGESPSPHHPSSETHPLPPTWSGCPPSISSPPSLAATSAPDYLFSLQNTKAALKTVKQIPPSSARCAPGVEAQVPEAHRALHTCPSPSSPSPPPSLPLTPSAPATGASWMFLQHASPGLVLPQGLCTDHLHPFLLTNPVICQVPDQMSPPQRSPPRSPRLKAPTYS